MPKVTVFIGLAGSGKSYYSERLAAEIGAKLFESLIGKGAIPELISHLQDGRDAIVEEITYCDPDHRTVILEKLSPIPDLQVEWVCFENNLEDANWNVKHRRNKQDVAGHLELNQRVSSGYTYPDGVSPKKIWRIPERG